MDYEAKQAAPREPIKPAHCVRLPFDSPEAGAVAASFLATLARMPGVCDIDARAHYANQSFDISFRIDLERA